jgi:hypothetical protein
MKKLSVIAIAIVLGLGGAAMAGDSGENHQDNTNTTGANPNMHEFTKGSSSFAKVERPAVTHHIKK